jgi:formylglycine-generating enzyme required for sulfatase activity
LVGAAVSLGCFPAPPPLPEIDEPGTTSVATTGGNPAGADGISTDVDATTGEAISTGAHAECGNGEVEDGEECDGIDPRGVTCESLGYAPGSLVCTEDCSFDVSGCPPEGMVLVPAGAFTMGSNVSPDEQPIRKVTLNGFYIDALEVTVDEYAACVRGKGCPPPLAGADYNYGVPGRGSHPINGVSWEGATAYCSNWAGGGGVKRLPTEAEWEKAARGSDAGTYPWGDEPEPSCDRVVMALDGVYGCGADSTGAVGSKPLEASPYGVRDLGGNVWELVNDWYGAYDPAELNDPTGPVRGTERVIRGGAWNSMSPDNIRSARRSSLAPNVGYFPVGFRCAMTWR